MCSQTYFYLFCATFVALTSAQLPSYLTPCSRSLPVDQLSQCLTQQARILQPNLVKGIPESGNKVLDPLGLGDIDAIDAGTFKIRSKDVILKGLKNIEVREIKWDLSKNIGMTTLFGNLTFLSGFETHGQLLLIPINGAGKLSVKMYDTLIVFSYKIKTVKDENGVEHIQTVGLKPKINYGKVKFHLKDLKGPDGGENAKALETTMNKVLNDNWQAIMEDVGPQFTLAVGAKVHEAINQFYLTVPLDQQFLP